MPSVEQQAVLQGKKNGEVRLFKNGRKPEVYAWDSQTASWNKIGDVIGGSNKKQFEGDRFFPAGEYDYVFDVEDDKGGNSLIPCNDEYDSSLLPPSMRSL